LQVSPHDLPNSAFRIPPCRAFRLPSSTQRGFTLLELIIGLSILAMFTVMITGIMRSSLRTVFWTRDMQLENDQLNRFIMLCRQTFQNLPSTGILTLKIIEAGDPVQQELTISGVPEAFAFGPNPMSYKDSILGMRPDLAATEGFAAANPTVGAAAPHIYFVGLSREDIIPTDPDQANRIASTTGEGLATPDDQGRIWMPLLANVTSVSWRFYKEDEDMWKDEWDSTDLPQLVEMNLMLAGRTLPLRSVFSLPTAKLTGANASLRPKTSSQDTSGSSQQAGGGNNAGGRGGKGGDKGGKDKGGDMKGRGGDTKGGDRGGRGGANGGRGGPGGSQNGGGRSSGSGAAPSGGGGGGKK
jgi:prepilin-type N-terminal cleavage/methylation domain-containing protein